MTTEERIQKEPWVEIYSRLRENHNLVDSINELIRLKETFEAARNKENAIAFAVWVAYKSWRFFPEEWYNDDSKIQLTSEQLYDLFEQNKKE